MTTARAAAGSLLGLGAGGVYVNFLDSDDDSSRVREAYGDHIYRRLAEVKAKYDPTTPSTTTRTSAPPDARAGPTGPKGFQKVAQASVA